jgi:hypothetical protein
VIVAIVSVGYIASPCMASVSCTDPSGSGSHAMLKQSEANERQPIASIASRDMPIATAGVWLCIRIGGLVVRLQVDRQRTMTPELFIPLLSGMER